MAYFVTLINMPEDRRIELGPFEWVTLTYGGLRAASSLTSDEDTTIAAMHNGLWITSPRPEDQFTDIDIDWK